MSPAKRARPLGYLMDEYGISWLSDCRPSATVGEVYDGWPVQGKWRVTDSRQNPDGRWLTVVEQVDE